MLNNKINKVSENQMPKLYGSPSPDTIRKFLLKAKHYFASKTADAWERTVEVNQTDANGNNVINAAGDAVMRRVTYVESMILIFPDGSKAGRYPVPINVQEPATTQVKQCSKEKRKLLNGKMKCNLKKVKRKVL